MHLLHILLPVFGVFIPALLLPGPDFIGVVRSAMTRGALGGLKTTAGVTLGQGVYATLSILGLSTVMLHYEWLTWVVRVAGGAYLIYLGVRLVFAGPGAARPAEVRQGDVPGDVPGDMQPDVQGSAFLFGFFVTLTNPKAVVLFASIFATAVTADTPAWVMALMIALVMASAATWYAIVSVFMASPPVMRRFAHARHVIERVAGVCFVAVGLRILADARNPVTP
ncbi:MAG TPA: LysE family translocator [Rhodopila sp.]|uniref:LysE family translocator n=1 Tax=Rhodopila sp. TaxID=2480087 RepID=UPI002D16E830|nr:LysE family translocator [Rhodopila sp.]HVY17295.1 LysE family translocator [Rhodopila sp.]